LTESEIRTLWYRYGDFGVQLNPDGSIISKTDRTDSTIARIKAAATAGDELAQRWVALRITNRMAR
jgi:hypothetical protein